MNTPLSDPIPARESQTTHRSAGRRRRRRMLMGLLTIILAMAAWQWLRQTAPESERLPAAPEREPSRDRFVLPPMRLAIESMAWTSDAGMGLELDGLRLVSASDPSPGIIPALHLTVAHARVSDRSGVWLELQGGRLELAAPDIAAGTVTVQRVVADRVTVYRRPHRAETDIPTPENERPEDRAGPSDFRIRAVIIERVDLLAATIHAAAGGWDTPVEGSATGQAAWHAGHGGFGGRLDVHVSEPHTVHAALAMQAEGWDRPASFDIALEYGANRLRGDGLLDWEGRRLDVSLDALLGRLSVSMAGSLDGSGTVPWADFELNATLASDTLDEPDWLDAWLPRGEGRLRLAASVDADQRQHLAADLAVSALATGWGGVGEGTLRIELTDLFGPVTGWQLDGAIETLAIPDARIDTASIRLTGSSGTVSGATPPRDAVAPADDQQPDTPWAPAYQALIRTLNRWRTAPLRTDLALTVDGQARDTPLQLAVAGSFEGPPVADGNHRFYLDRLEGSVASVAIALRERLAVQHTAGRLVVAPFEFQVGPAWIVGGGWWAEHDIGIRAHWRLPLAWIPGVAQRQVDADIEGRLRIDGNADAPRLELELEGTNWSIGGEPVATSLLDDVSLRLWDAPDGMMVQVTAHSGETNRFDAQTLLPFQWRLRPTPALIPVAAPRLQGTARAAIPLEVLADLLLADDTRRVGGLLEGALQWQGTPDQPDVTGTLAVRDARYHDLLLGTRLRDVVFIVRGDREGLVIDTAEASDRDTGRMTLEGRLDFWPWGVWRHDLRLTLERMRIVERDDATAFLDGNLTLNGDWRKTWLRGDLQLGPVEIRLPDRLPTLVPVLPIVSPDPDQPLAVPRPALLPELGLEVTIHAPNRIFVRNRAVDTEWQGTVTAGGTLARPSVEGSFQAIHGRFMVLGRRFTVRQGVVQFPGYPVVPRFDAVAETEAGGITARLRLSGTPQQAHWELSSVPDLPEDEILAHVFFNRPTGGTPTAGQALRMAQAAEALAGGGRLTDVLEYGRRALRVDRVDLVEGETPEEAARVSVGKYIGSRGYVDLEKDVTGDDGGRVIVSIDLTPAISLETTVETDGERGIGIRWRHDY